MAVQRWNVLFAGRVQGVGFRYQTLAIAGRYSVHGWVANLPSGEVQLVVEGDSGELGKLLVEIEEEMAPFIRSTEVDRGPATGGLGSFEIRR